MAWIAARLDQVPRQQVESISSSLWELGAQGVQEEPATGLTVPLQQPWDTAPEPEPPARARLTAWFEDPDQASVDAEISRVWPAGTLTWTRDGADTDWSTAWREGYTTFQLGPVTITPPWEPAVEGAIILEPGTGFGTGHHPTTHQAFRLTLQALHASSHPQRVLDVGTGSGLLALGVARLGHEAHGIDIATASVEEAKENAKRNQLTVGFSTTPVHQWSTPMDLVIANIHAEALCDLAPALLRIAHGHLVLAGILDTKRADVLAAYAPTLGEPDAQDIDGEWVALRWAR